MPSSQSLCLWQAASPFVYAKQPVSFCMTISQSRFVWQSVSPISLTSSWPLFEWQATGPFYYDMQPVLLSMISYYIWQAARQMLFYNISLKSACWAGDIALHAIEWVEDHNVYHVFNCLLFIFMMNILIFHTPQHAKLFYLPGTWTLVKGQSGQAGYMFFFFFFFGVFFKNDFFFFLLEI